MIVNRRDQMMKNAGRLSMNMDFIKITSTTRESRMQPFSIQQFLKDKG